MTQKKRNLSQSSYHFLYAFNQFSRMPYFNLPWSKLSFGSSSGFSWLSLVSGIFSNVYLSHSKGFTWGCTANCHVLFFFRHMYQEHGRLGNILFKKKPKYYLIFVSRKLNSRFKFRLHIDSEVWVIKYCIRDCHFLFSYIFHCGIYSLPWLKYKSILN